MKQIKLTQGQIALIDDDDFEKYGHLKWYAAWSPRTKSFYARRNGTGSPRKTKCLSREIMGEPIGMKVDHRDHNTLNDQKSNLRVCTNSQNCRNRKGPQINNSSNYRGVHWHKKQKAWCAAIQFDGKQIHLGSFVDKEMAIHSYLEANKKYFGEFGVIGNQLEGVVTFSFGG